MEDVPVATRALEIWSFVVAVVEHFQALPSSRRPFSNKSYDILVKHHKDNSIKFKFQFFIDIVNILAPFLKHFQTDGPVMLFVDEMLALIIDRLRKILLLRSAVNDVVTAHLLIKLDITKKKVFYHNLLSCQLHHTTLEISSSKKIKLIDQCVSIVKTIVLKLQERSPLKYLTVCCSSCLIPRSIVTESESVILQINKVVDKLCKHQQLNNIRSLMKLNYSLKSLLPIMISLCLLCLLPF